MTIYESVSAALVLYLQEVDYVSVHILGAGNVNVELLLEGYSVGLSGITHRSC